MQSVGFEKRQRHWTHPRSRYLVEFPPGPVAIGEETIRTFAERETRMGTLRLLAPTECVMDRLAWYIHEADTQRLEQAVRVATLDLNPVAPVDRSSAASEQHIAECAPSVGMRPWGIHIL
jgi:hypothetical protein